MQSPPDEPQSPHSLLVTGAGGYIGAQLIKELAREPRAIPRIVATDVRPIPQAQREPGVDYLKLDVRDPSLELVLRANAVETVVHLAAIVDAGPSITPEMQFEIDVLGTLNVLRSCAAVGVRHIVVTSSGAAYGYHADNPQPLGEDAALRGNHEFGYSEHKRLVEQLLARYRRTHPQLRQLVLRPCTVLGPSVRNQIVALFEKPVILGVRGAQSPFVFVSDRDVVACIVDGALRGKAGIYNLAGDGTMTLAQIAARIRKRYVEVPAALLRLVLQVLHPLGLSRYGPEQVEFLRYRPVLSNVRLKEEFGFTPSKTSSEAFDEYWSSRCHA